MVVKQLSCCTKLLLTLLLSSPVLFHVCHSTFTAGWEVMLHGVSKMGAYSWGEGESRTWWWHSRSWFPKLGVKLNLAIFWGPGTKFDKWWDNDETMMQKWANISCHIDNLMFLLDVQISWYISLTVNNIHSDQIFGGILFWRNISIVYVSFNMGNA